jgi:hypothetical protein
MLDRHVTFTAGVKIMRLRYQFRLLGARYEFWIALLAMTLFSVYAFLAHCVSYYGENHYFLLSADQLFIGRATNSFALPLRLIIPLIAALPFADVYFGDKQRNTLPVVLYRYDDVKAYYFSNLFIVFLSSFIVIFIPLLLNMGLNAITFPVSSIRNFAGNQANDTWHHAAFIDEYILLPSLLIQHPYVYNFVFAIFQSIFAGLAGVFVFSFSFYIKRNKILVTSSFFIIHSVLDIISIALPSIGVNLSFLSYLFAYELSAAKQPLIFLVLLSALLLSIIISGVKNKRILEDLF